MQTGIQSFDFKLLIQCILLAIYVVNYIKYKIKNIIDNVRVHAYEIIYQ